MGGVTGTSSAMGISMGKGRGTGTSWRTRTGMRRGMGTCTDTATISGNAIVEPGSCDEELIDLTGVSSQPHEEQ